MDKATLNLLGQGEPPGPSLNCGGHLTLTNSAQLYAYSSTTNPANPLYGASIIIAGNIVLASNCWIYPISHPVTGGSVFFQMYDLTIAPFAGINADSNGFSGGTGYLARNVWECDRMIEACDKAGVTLTTCHDRRYHGEWMALKQIVDTGLLGDIFSWKLDHNQNVAIPTTCWAYWKDGIGGGCIMSCLTHQIDGLRWYGGEVESVACMSTVRPERMQGEFQGAVLARMRSGALAELSINWWTRSNQAKNGLWYERVHVCGTRGEAYRINGRGTWLLLHERSEAAAKQYGEAVFTEFVQIPSGDWGGHERCVDQWLRLLRGEPSEINTSGRDCRGTVEVAEAAYQAFESGHTISLPIQPKPTNCTVRWAAAMNGTWIPSPGHSSLRIQHASSAHWPPSCVNTAPASIWRHMATPQPGSLSASQRTWARAPKAFP